MSQRKKPKKYSKMNYQQKELYVKDQLKGLGQEGAYYLNSGGRGNASTGFFDLEESEKKLRSAADNDYNRRESLKYGVDSGDKRFKGLDASSGFNSMDALVNTDRAINKYGYNKLGHKNMSSSADKAAVSNSLFNKSRDKFAESMSPDDQADAAKSKSQNDEPVVLSDELQQAEDTVKEFDNKDYDIYNQGKSTSDGNDQRQQASQSFLDKYKMNLKGNMRPKLPV
jgi:hypothetical protein